VAKKRKASNTTKPEASISAEIIRKLAAEFIEQQKRKKPKKKKQELLPYDVWNNWRPGIDRSKNVVPESAQKGKRESYKRYIDRLYSNAGKGYNLRIFTVYFEPAVDRKQRVQYGRITKFTVDSFLRFIQLRKSKYKKRGAPELDFSALLAEVNENGDIGRIHTEVLWKTD
jgi:hypothetical protein